VLKHWRVGALGVIQTKAHSFLGYLKRTDEMVCWCGLPPRSLNFAASSLDKQRDAPPEIGMQVHPHTAPTLHTALK
jgi:hypothetical protein